MANYNVSGLMTLAELAKSKQQSWFVYILLCSDNTLYTGITNNIDKRLEDHQRGVYSKRGIQTGARQVKEKVR